MTHLHLGTVSFTSRSDGTNKYGGIYHHTRCPPYHCLWSIYSLNSSITRILDGWITRIPSSHHTHKPGASDGSTPRKPIEGSNSSSTSNGGGLQRGSGRNNGSNARMSTPTSLDRKKGQIRSRINKGAICISQTRAQLRSQSAQHKQPKQRRKTRRKVSPKTLRTIQVTRCKEAERRMDAELVPKSLDPYTPGSVAAL